MFLLQLAFVFVFWTFISPSECNPMFGLRHDIEIMNGHVMVSMSTLSTDKQALCPFLCKQRETPSNITNVQKYSKANGKCECFFIPPEHEFVDASSQLPKLNDVIYLVDCKSQMKLLILTKSS